MSPNIGLSDRSSTRSFVLTCKIATKHNYVSSFKNM